MPQKIQRCSPVGGLLSESNAQIQSSTRTQSCPSIPGFFLDFLFIFLLLLAVLSCVLSCLCSPPFQAANSQAEGLKDRGGVQVRGVYGVQCSG